jgi:hypothetical protein
MGVDKTEVKVIINHLPFTETRVCEMAPEEFGILSDEVHVLYKVSGYRMQSIGSIFSPMFTNLQKIRFY